MGGGGETEMTANTQIDRAAASSSNGFLPKNEGQISTTPAAKHVKSSDENLESPTGLPQSSIQTAQGLIHEFLASNPSNLIQTLLVLIKRFWKDTPDVNHSYLRFPQELKKYDCKSLADVPPLDLLRCLAAIHLEIVFGPVPPDLKLSLRGTYWFLQQLHEAVKSKWIASVSFITSLAPTDPNWFSSVVAPLMQKAANPDDGLLLSTDKTVALTFQLTEALTIAYSEFLTQRISVAANDAAIFTSNWCFNASSPISPPLDQLPIDSCSDAFEVTRRALRSLDPLLKSLEILIAISGLLVASQNEDDLNKTLILYECLSVEFNAIISVAIHLSVALALKASGSFDNEEKRMIFFKPFRLIRHRIDGIKGRFNAVRSDHSTEVLHQFDNSISKLIVPSDTLVSFFATEITQDNAYSVLTEGIHLPLPGKQAFERYSQSLEKSRPHLMCSSAQSSVMVAALDSDLASLERGWTRRRRRMSGEGGNSSSGSCFSDDADCRRKGASPADGKSPQSEKSQLKQETKSVRKQGDEIPTDSSLKNTVPWRTKTNRKNVDQISATSESFIKEEGPETPIQQSISDKKRKQEATDESALGERGVPHSRCSPAERGIPPCSYTPHERSVPTDIYPPMFLQDESINASHLESSFDPGIYASWEVDHPEVQLEQKVGSGATATVFKGTWRGTEVAVKKMSGQLSADPDSLSKFKREIQILLKLRHPNLTLLMGACVRKRPYFVIMEYCIGGDLFTLLHLPEKSCHQVVQLSLHQKLKIATDIAKGMVYLHRMTPEIIVHRDLKSLNILLSNVLRSRSDEPSVKITDFGLSQLRSNSPSELLHQTAAVGTYHWMAPEVLMSQPYNEKVDVYSYGILLYEIFTQSIPYSSLPPLPSFVSPSSSSTPQFPSMQNPVNLALAVVQGLRPDVSRVPHDCPSSIVNLMTSCWKQDPVMRPNFESVLQTLKSIRPPNSS